MRVITTVKATAERIAIGVLVVLAACAAACSGGPSSPGVASLGATTTTEAPSAAGSIGGEGGPGTAGYAQALKYARCMRAHGVPNFPDPDPSGNFAIDGRTVGASSTTIEKANASCAHLLPNGGKPTAQQQQQAIAMALKLARCMRAHGVTDFPDPVVRQGGVSIRIGGHGVDANSSTFQSAISACAADFPGGAPPPAAGRAHG